MFCILYLLRCSLYVVFVEVLLGVFASVTLPSTIETIEKPQDFRVMNGHAEAVFNRL